MASALLRTPARFSIPTPSNGENCVFTIAAPGRQLPLAILAEDPHPHMRAADRAMASRGAGVVSLEIVPQLLELQAAAAQARGMAAGEPLFRLKQVKLEGVPALSPGDLTASYQIYLNRELSAQDLAAIAAAITVRYRAAGFHLSRALIPPQDMRSGVLRITVVEGVIEQVGVSGAAAAFGLERLLRYGGRCGSHPI